VKQSREKREERQMDRRAEGRQEAVRETVEDRGWWGPDDLVVAPGDQHERGVEFLCVGEAA